MLCRESWRRVFEEVFFDSVGVNNANKLLASITYQDVLEEARVDINTSMSKRRNLFHSV